MLPHGSEGQGPDHSNAHLERFLQLAACNNMQICNVTTPSQYFHLLRRQVKARFRIPLILMTPKSLLRHPKVISTLEDLAKGSFRQVLDDSTDPEKIRRILLCSGKVYYDLLTRREEVGRDDTALIRIEQLYPFPCEMIKSCIERYSSSCDVIWVQEEPRNYGAWSYLHERFCSCIPNIRLSYLGRGESPSSETGSHKQYQAEQKKLVQDAIGSSKESHTTGESNG